MKINTLAICKLTVVPVRVSHEDSSEMVTQLLFGEVVKIIEHSNQWVKIEVIHDGYIGWADNKQLLSISEEAAQKITQNKNRQQEPELSIETPWGLQTVLQGSPIISKEKLFKIDQCHFGWYNEIPTQKINNVTTLATSYLNAPYLWGGRTKYGIDCSGFTQTIYHQLGVNLKRDASQQVTQGEEVSFENQKVGDLAFFTSEKTGNITHVGIVLSNSKVIHIHGRGRIDTLNTNGIYNEDEQYCSHQFFNLKRYGI